MPELKFVLKVGSKGEIYTTKEIRDLLGLKVPGEVIAIVLRDSLIIKSKKSLKELIKKRKEKITLSAEEFEKISEDMQKIY